MELNIPIESPQIQKVFVEIKKKDYDQALVLLNEGISAAQAEANTELVGVYYSLVGVLYKLKRDFREAWRYYDQAEKLLPENPILKLISARLLIEVFSQCDAAIRKVREVEKKGLVDPLMAHHVEATYGLAHAKKGDKGKAGDCLKKLIDAGFDRLLSAANIDFKLVELCVRKSWHKDLCKFYVDQAALFAQKTGETAYVRLFERLRGALAEENPKVL